MGGLQDVVVGLFGGTTDAEKAAKDAQRAEEQAAVSKDTADKRALANEKTSIATSQIAASTANANLAKVGEAKRTGAEDTLGNTNIIKRKLTGG